MNLKACCRAHAYTHTHTHVYLLTSMKSALAGMYPAISRDSTESNEGRGGSSVAVVPEKYTNI